MYILFPPLLALGCGALLTLWKHPKPRNTFTLLLCLATSCLLALCCFQMEGRAVTLLTITPLFSISFRIDAVNRVFLLLIAFLWPLACLYAFEYMEAEPHPRRFFMLYLLAYGCTQLLAMSANLFTLYLFYEMLTLVTLPLVTHHEDSDSLQAGMTYLKYTMGGAALGLIGLIVLACNGGSGSFLPGGVAGNFTSMENTDLLRTAFVLSFVGFGAKAALYPLSRWLPRASVAPTPVTALLHAVAVVNAGAFACIRLVYDCFGVSLLRGSWAQIIVVLLSAFTIFFGAVYAVRERHLKRRLAWSTVYNLSYMLFSAAIMTQAGLKGALTHLLFHGMIKTMLFDCAGVFQQKAQAEYVPELRGIFHAMPWTVVLYTIAGVTLTGIPPFVGFLSKWNILTAAMENAAWYTWIGACAVILSSVLACVYLLEPAIQMIFLPGQNPRGKDPSWQTLMPLGLLAVSIVLLGIWPDPVWQLLSSATALY